MARKDEFIRYLMFKLPKNNELIPIKIKFFEFLKLLNNFADLL